MGFNEASADKKPTLICVGTVSELPPPRLTEKETYVYQPVIISGEDLAPARTRYGLLYRPEWFRRGFQPDELLKFGKGVFFVYKKNIAARDQMSALLGLCSGDRDVYNRLAETLFDLESVTPEAVHEVLSSIILGRQVGYILKQARTATGEKDPEGKNIYVLEPYYELDSWFSPTEENLEKWRRREEEAKKRNKGANKFVVAFGEAPF